jgi:hypothetical protein
MWTRRSFQICFIVSPGSSDLVPVADEWNSARKSTLAVYLREAEYDQRKRALVPILPAQTKSNTTAIATRHDKLVRKLLPFSSWLRLLSSTEDRP